MRTIEHIESRATSHPRLTPTRVCLALASMVIGAAGLSQAIAEDHANLPRHLSGLLNDYTPASVAGGPYEMHGKWSLSLSERGAATFSAQMTMETADFANPDPNHDPAKLGAHTHHILMTDGVIHNDLTDPVNWMTACPTFKPPTAGGFVVTGTAYVTGNGANPPFGNPSSVTICVLGGMQNLAISGPQAFVVFSNFTLAFASGSPASTHFGTQAIHGVVVECEGRERDSKDCRVAVVE